MTGRHNPPDSAHARTDRFDVVGRMPSEVGPNGLHAPSVCQGRFGVVQKAVFLACALAATAIVVGLQSSPASSAGYGSRVLLTSFEVGLISQLNDIRIEHGLVPLRVSGSLSASAGAHTAEMLADGYFTHSSADGAPFLTRIGHWYRSAGFTYWAAGENLLWSSKQIDASQAVEIWMNSAEHRQNVLSPLWREIGISVLTSPDAHGVYGDNAVTVIATDFGVRN